MLSLFARRASVGLMVLAPSPLARPLETVLCLLLPLPLPCPFALTEEEGVPSLPHSLRPSGISALLRGGAGGCIMLFTLFARPCAMADEVDERRGVGSGGAVVVLLVLLCAVETSC